MSLGSEYTKVKRTGFAPSFLFGGLLAAAVPILNMGFRSERYLTLPASPVQILLDANWQMMAMLNILLVTAGACLMYHTEYADRSLWRMRTLPMIESRLFFGKLVLLAVMCLVTLVIEAAGIAVCTCHWFAPSEAIWAELLRYFGYALLMMLPAASASLLIASACSNMWISLGINVVCVFTATMLPTQNSVLSLFPFALPFQMLSGMAADIASRYMVAAAAEFVVIAFSEILYLKIRRLFV